MAKVVIFPQKEKLPKALEDELHRSAKSYIEVLYASMKLLASDEYDEDELAKIQSMVAAAYAKGMEMAIEELEKGES